VRLHESMRLRELGQLLRLRRLREDAARTERDEKRRARDAAQAAVREREALIEQARVRRDALGAYVAGHGAATIARLAAFAGARREALDEALERAEYGLIDDEEALARAERALDEAQAVWLRAMARNRAVEQLNERTRRGFMQAAQQRAERELDKAQPVGMQMTNEGTR